MTTMETRDLGTHVVELHDLGTLDIIGSGTRLTLPAHEALELMHWLDKHKDILSRAIHEEQAAQRLPPGLQVSTDEDAVDGVDLPEDEP